MSPIAVSVRAIIAALCVAAASGCGVMMSGVWNPMTPQESRNQVIDVAREVVSVLGLDVVEAWFWHSPCNGRGGPPFRGQMRIGYPRAADHGIADDEMAKMVAELRRSGWSDDPDFHSHSPALTKNRVTVVLRPQDPNASTRGVEVIGECRDVTTTMSSRGPVQAVHLG